MPGLKSVRSKPAPRQTSRRNSWLPMQVSWPIRRRAGRGDPWPLACLHHRAACRAPDTRSPGRGDLAAAHCPGARTTAVGSRNGRRGEQHCSLGSHASAAARVLVLGRARLGHGAAQNRRLRGFDVADAQLCAIDQGAAAADTRGCAFGFPILFILPHAGLCELAPAPNLGSQRKARYWRRVFKRLSGQCYAPPNQCPSSFFSTCPTRRRRVDILSRRSRCDQLPPPDR